MTNHQQLDISRLSLERPAANASQKTQRQTRWFSRYVVPAGILIGFIALLSAAAGRQLFPTARVTVVPVIVKRSVVQQAGTPLFQAAGWIEPSPMLVSVPALTPGIIDHLLVVEGDELQQGEPIARLISIDVEIAVEQSRATLALREGERQRAQAELAAAESRLANPLHLKNQLADAQSQLAKTITERDKLPFLVSAAEANLRFAEKSMEGKQGARGAVSGIVVLQAERDLANARVELAELRARGPNLEREINSLEERVKVLNDQLELLIEEHRHVAEARAKILSANAALDAAKLEVRKAELELERTLVVAPMTGRILRIVATPGTRVMGLEHTAGQSSSTVVEMYDPERLQVRADVRLEDVPAVATGALVEIRTASSSVPIQGRVLQATSTANIQKNTLEVKVELMDPPDTIRPEMLVTATFLAPQQAVDPSDASQEAETLFVPEQLVIASEGEAVVWVVNGNQQAIRRSVTVGKTGSDGLVEVTHGLVGTDKLIASGTSELSPGQRVMIHGEDLAMGMGR